MNLRRTSARLALGTVAAAVASTALVAASTGSASAATVSGNITCSVSGSPIGTFPYTVTAALPSTGEAGFPVPAGLLTYSAAITVPDAFGPLLNGAKSADYAVSLGTNKLVAPFTVTSVTDDAGPTSTANATGSNNALVLPAAGTYTIVLPSSFTVATGAGSATCTDAAPPTDGTITLSKQVSTVKAKAPKSGQAGSAVPVKIKVKGDKAAKGGVVPTGKVTIKDGSKTVGKGKLKNGKVTISVKLARGSHSLKVTYKGDGYVAKGTAKPLKVTIH